MSANKTSAVCRIACMRPSAEIGPLVGVVFLTLVVAWPVLWLYWNSAFRITSWPMEVSGFPAGRDFANQWFAGRAALAGQLDLLFDRGAYISELGRHLDPRVAAAGPVLYWSYPPTAIWLGLPFAGFDYAAALALWTLVSIIVFAWAARAGTDLNWSSRRGLGVALVLFAAPGTLISIGYGQTALLTSCLLVGGLAVLPRHSVFAGICLAALIVKPHLGLAVPIALIAMRAMRTFVATTVATVLGVAVTAATFGFDVWRGFFAITLPHQTEDVLLGSATRSEMLMSIYFLLRQLGASIPAATIGHAVVALAVLAAMYASMRRCAHQERRITLVALATLLISPYLQIYELALGSLLVARLLAQSEPVTASVDQIRLRACDVTLAGLLIILPIVAIVSFNMLHVSLAPALLLVAFALAVANAWTPRCESHSPVG